MRKPDTGRLRTHPPVQHGQRAGRGPEPRQAHSAPTHLTSVLDHPFLLSYIANYTVRQTVVLQIANVADNKGVWECKGGRAWIALELEGFVEETGVYWVLKYEQDS